MIINAILIGAGFGLLTFTIYKIVKRKKKEPEYVADEWDNWHNEF